MPYTTTVIDPSVFRPTADGVVLRPIRHQLNLDWKTETQQQPPTITRVSWRRQRRLVVFALSDFEGKTGDNESRMTATLRGRDGQAPSLSSSGNGSGRGGGSGDTALLHVKVQYQPSTDGFRRVVSKQRPPTASDVMRQTPRLYANCHVTSKYHRRMGVGVHDMTFSRDRGFSCEFDISCTKDVPSNVLLHVQLLMSCDTRQRERMALCVIGESSVLLQSLPAAALTLPSVYPEDPIIGKCSIECSGTKGLTFGSAIVRAEIPKIQERLDVHSHESYAEIWKVFPSGVQFPGRKPVFVPRPQDEAFLVQGLMVPRTVYYYWASKYSVSDPVAFSESNVRLGCIAAGVDPSTLRSGGATLDDHSLRMVLFWTAVSFPRALSATFDYRGSPYTPPLGSDSFDVMGGACVELTSLITNVLLALRDSGPRSELCRPLAEMLRRDYRIVQYLVTSRSGGLELNPREDRIMCHAAAGLVPKRLLAELQTPLRTAVSPSGGAAARTAVYLDALSPNSFGKDFPSQGRLIDMEAGFLAGGALPGENSVNVMFGTKTRTIGHCIRMTLVDEPQQSGIHDLVCMSAAGGAWSVGIDSKELFDTGVDTKTRRLFLSAHGTIAMNSPMMQMIEPLLEETAHMTVSDHDGASERFDVAAIVERARAVVAARAPSASVDRSVRFPATIGWRIWARVNNDDDSLLSVLKTNLKDSQVDALEYAKAYGVTTVHAEHLKTITVYGQTVCEICVFVYL